MNNVNNLLNSELAGAENIKSKQTRESIKSAITSIKESKLKSNTLTNFIFRAKTLQSNPQQWFGNILWRDLDGRCQD